MFRFLFANRLRPTPNPTQPLSPHHCPTPPNPFHPITASFRFSCYVEHHHTQASLSGTFPPNSVVTGYAVQGTLLISPYPSPEIVSVGLTLSKLEVKCAKRLGTKCGKSIASKHTRKHGARPPMVKIVWVPFRFERFGFIDDQHQ